MTSSSISASHETVPRSRSFTHRGRRNLGVMALMLALTAPAAAAETVPATLNDTARMLGGLPPASGSVLEPLAKSPSFQQHEKEFSRAWSSVEANQLAKIRPWVAKEMPKANPALIYFFSGPDYLYANAFFPNATTIVMAGLEIPGPVPKMTEASLRGLPLVRGSLNSILNYSFFRTAEMRQRFGGGTFTGTLPILYVFLARAGKTVEETTLVSLDDKGVVVAGDAKEARPSVKGAKIVFSGEDGVKRTLFYFQADISNRGPSLDQVLTFAKNVGPSDALIKSASYLLHTDGFSKVRGFLLENTQTILEDDSGIPLRHFAKDWSVKPLGSYTGPISIFSQHYQRDVATLFRTAPPPAALPFGFGYRIRAAQSSVMLATRKTAD